jgi:YggT family protein
MVSILALVLTALKWLIFIDVILSWVMPNQEQFPRSFTKQITDPLYAPIRAVIKPQATGGLDFSPIVVLILLQVMESMLHKAVV